MSRKYKYLYLAVIAQVLVKYPVLFIQILRILDRTGQWREGTCHFVSQDFILYRL